MDDSIREVGILANFYVMYDYCVLFYVNGS